MPRPIGSVTTPSYRFHKPSGQAVVTIEGQDHYLGPHNTQASKREYDRLIGEWLAAGRRANTQPDDLLVLELINQYRKFATTYYGDNGAGEVKSIILAMRLVAKLYGHTQIKQFGPLALKAVRQAMVELDWSRGYINSQIGRIVRMFKWGVENELVRPEILQALKAVAGLRRGKTPARETPPVRPVADHHVAAILCHVSRQVKVMIELQQLTGMRPGEVCIMRGCDIDTTGQPWTYRPEKHKTQFHGHERVIYIGPRAQAVVAPFLRPNVSEYLFNPAEAEATRRAIQHEARKTPLSCGNRPGTNRKRRPRRPPGGRYDTNEYRRAIERGCDLAFPPPADLARVKVDGKKGKRWETHKEWRQRLGERWSELTTWWKSHRWHPHQLRHSAATRLRKEYGLEAAQVILGHQTLAVTEIYAEKNVEAAQRIMAAVG